MRAHGVPLAGTADCGGPICFFGGDGARRRRLERPARPLPARPTGVGASPTRSPWQRACPAVVPIHTNEVMDFRESEEHGMLRESVYRIASKYGHEYYARESRSGGKADALWKELADAGFLGINLPEEHGGGGLGIYELAIVCEELARAGTPFLLLIVSPAICGTILARYGTAEQRDRLSAWSVHRQGEDGRLRSPSRCRLELPRHRDPRAARRKRLSADGHQVLTSPDSDEAENVLVVARTRAPRRPGGRALAVHGPTNAPGLSSTRIPVEIHVAREAVHAFFRRCVRGEQPTDRGRGIGLKPGLHWPGSRSASRGLRWPTGSGCMLWKKRRAMRASARCGHVPIGTHQGIAHPLAKAKIEVEQARLMTSKAAWLYDTDDAGRRGGGQHGQVRCRGSGPGRPGPGDPDARRQRSHRRSSGSPICGAWLASCAPPR